jgi:hypothetical protein
MMKFKIPFLAKLFNAMAIPGIILAPASFASLALYDSEISEAHGGGAGNLPYEAVLTTPAVFDGTNIEFFDFGAISGDATFEFILSGDPVAGGQNGYIGRADANSGNSLRYEQWDDTGALGFTRARVADNFFSAPNAASPADDTHITYRWTEATGTMDLFINGTATDSITGATFEMPTGPGHLGNVSDGGNEGMIGTIHRVTTYNSLVNDTTIQQHADAWLATGDPSIGVPMSVDLALDGSAQSFELVVKNLGESNVLIVTAVTVDGVNADYFTIDTALPLNIDPGEEIDLKYTVDPGGANGDVGANFSILSNDALNSEAEVPLSGLIRDPQISIQTALDFGASDVEVTQMIEVQNLGRARALNLAKLEITGTDAANFSASGPTSIAVGGSGNIEVTFTPDNSGGFTAQLEIGSDDPGSPVTLVALSAFTPIDEGFMSAYDSMISADHGGGVGILPYAAVLTTPAVFDGTNIELFDFGAISGDATFEFILSGDPVAGGRNGYIGRADANPANSLRYEQWDDTGQLGFTRAGVADNTFSAPNTASPTDDTHVTYRWTQATSTMDLFINGATADSIVGATFEMPTGPGHLGNVSDGGNEGMIGTIHRITTYDILVDDATIQQHANAFVTGVGASEFKVNSIDFNQVSGLITLVWNSIPGAVYAVDYSFDLVEWNELDDSVPADDKVKSYSTPSNLLEGDTKIFFRVRRL